MSITIYDRVQETTTVTGTGSVTLLGASPGYVDFNSTVGVGNHTYYGIVDNTNKIWEIGIGTLINSTTLSRDSVISSSSSGSKVNFVGHTANVFLDVPAYARVQWPDLGSAASYNAGSSANNVVLLDGSARLPAIDGSQLTNIAAIAELPIQTGSDPKVIIKNADTNAIVQTDSNKNIQINNASEVAIFGVDGSGNPQINNINSNKVIGIDGNGNPFFHNNAGNQTFAMDGNGNPWIYNTQGVDVFSIDGNGNPVLSSGNAPGFDTGIFGFDSNLDPHIINNNGQTVFGVDSSTGRPKISNNVYPSDGIGNLTNDGIGNLSWVPPFKPINSQTGTSYTLELSDKMVTLFNASAITLTIPAYSSVNFQPNTEIDLVQLGVGQVTIAAAGGVVINSYLNKVNIAGQYAGATLKMLSTDNWLLIGNLA